LLSHVRQAAGHRSSGWGTAPAPWTGSSPGAGAPRTPPRPTTPQVCTHGLVLAHPPPIHCFILLLLCFFFPFCVRKVSVFALLIISSDISAANSVADLKLATFIVWGKFLFFYSEAFCVHSWI
jgi:hypothetical protein